MLTNEETFALLNEARNGNDFAKKSARFITDINDNSGVAKAIKKYVFGE